jgi:hypothetical protein
VAHPTVARLRVVLESQRAADLGERLERLPETDRVRASARSSRSSPSA